MHAASLRTTFLTAGLCLALAGCSIPDRDGGASDASPDPALQQGSSPSAPAVDQATVRQASAEAWPGRNVGSPISLGVTPAQSGDAAVAERGGAAGIERVSLPAPPGSDGLSGSSTGPSGLVDVNLNKVRRAVARYLNVDARKIPATIVLPVTVAASLCGIDATALTKQQRPGGKPICMAKNAGMASDVVEPTIQ
ncbi:MAG TPA: hypothetical protein VGP50_06740 [Stellaceae bacterium]|nr:hypothetical protein [Stellaceae bacterium]